MKQTQWSIKTYVIQHIGDAGQWYNAAMFNINPLDWNLPELDAHLKALMPPDKPWRLLERVSQESIKGGNYADFEFEEHDCVEIIDPKVLTFSKKAIIVSMSEFILKPFDGKIEVAFDNMWIGWYRPSQLRKINNKNLKS